MSASGAFRLIAADGGISEVPSQITRQRFLLGAVRGPNPMMLTTLVDVLETGNHGCEGCLLQQRTGSLFM